MYIESNLIFFEKILNNMNLKTHTLLPNTPPTDYLDFGIRHLLSLDKDYHELIGSLFHHTESNTVYRLADAFYCIYIFFLLPTEQEELFVIGPYTEIPNDKELLLKNAEKHSIPVQLLPQIENYYSHLPLITDDSTLFTLVNSFAELLWDGIDNYYIHRITKSLSQEATFLNITDNDKTDDTPTLTMEILEKRYEVEKKLMSAVSKGLSHKAELLLNSLGTQALEERVGDPVRNIKNYTIILNTLLRKAAERGDVHPLHIDALSSDYARKIELIHSPNSGLRLQKEMIHKYCLLVKNHSLKGHSLLVRKIISTIDSDLTADLSLKSMADMLNVNASYLSTLFKKETGSTLTEYCNRKRVEHAIFLLNSTTMQIQDIAQHCGISDVNYFTKIFKKIVGKTPREYRSNIL